MKIRIMESKDGQYYVRIDAANGEPVWVTETYKTHNTAANVALKTQLALKEQPEIVDETYEQVHD